MSAVEEDLPAFRGVQIHLDRALVAVRGHVGGEGRSPIAGFVAGPGHFELDDIGAEIAHQHGRIGAGKRARDVDDAYAGERAFALGVGVLVGVDGVHCE
jgi:hypothetical protein